MAHSLGPALAGSLVAGAGQGAALVLTMSAAQEEIPDSHLGRVTGLISLVHRGAHATGLLLVSPLFAVVATRSVFVAAAFAIPCVSSWPRPWRPGRQDGRHGVARHGLFGRRRQAAPRP